MFYADVVTSAGVGQLAPPSEQQQQQHGEPLPQGDITINARSLASSIGGPLEGGTKPWREARCSGRIAGGDGGSGEGPAALNIIY